MLEPSRDRLDYGALLRPPEADFVLELAVGCTYSLDLSALLAALLPLGFDGDAGSSCKENPVFTLHVLRQLLPKLHIFCDAAAIKVPELQHNRLLALLDRAAHPVRHRTAFHPKFWLLKFDRNGEKRYRLAVLSKNVTFDRSWDVAMFFDGALRETSSNGAPLADMLAFLKNSQRGGGKRFSDLAALAEEIKFVEFSNREIQPGELHLIPFGVGSPAPQTDDCLLKPGIGFHRLLVMSPFLSPDAVEQLFKRGREGGEKLLFTRKNALAGLSPGQLTGVNCYCIRDEVYSGERSYCVEAPPENPQVQDVHAKIYLYQRYQGATPMLYLGSANLTQNGTQEQNVELLVRVKLRGNNVFETFRKDLLPDDRNGVFELCEPAGAEEKSDAEKAQDELERIFRKISLAGKKFSATVQEQTGQYAVTLHGPDLSGYKCKIEIAPLNGQWHPFAPEISFAPQPVKTLADFYRIRLVNEYAKLERLLMVDTLGTSGLRAARQEALESACLKNSADVLEYLSYVLAEDAYALAAREGISRSANTADTAGTGDFFALYEKMLHWTAADRERLLDVRDVIHRRGVGDSGEMQKLLALCETFYRAAGGRK